MLDAATVPDEPLRPAMAANTSNPPTTIVAIAMVSSRRPNPVFRADAPLVADAVGGAADAAAGEAASVADAETLGVEAGVARDVTEGVTVGSDNGRSAGDVGDTADTLWWCAHFSHPSQTEADSGISRPHDAQRFTRVAPAPAHTAGAPDAASRVPSETA